MIYLYLIAIVCIYFCIYFCIFSSFFSIFSMIYSVFKKKSLKSFCSHQGLEHVVRLFVRYLQELTDTDSPIRDKAVKQDVRGPESTHSESGEVPGSLRNRLTGTLTPCAWTGSAEDRTRTGCVGVLCPPAGLQSEAEEASGGRWWSTVRAEHLEEQRPTTLSVHVRRRWESRK